MTRLFFRSFRYAIRDVAAGAQFITAGRSGGMADDIEYRNQFFALPLNPRIASTFVGFSNYINILSDPGFWHALWMTIWYTALVVAGSTALGLGVAMFFEPGVSPA